MAVPAGQSVGSAADNSATHAANIALRVAAAARRDPERAAIIYPVRRGSGLSPEGYAHLTFGRLDHRTRLYASRLRGRGVRRGMRTILMVPPGPDFFALTFALMRLGAAPVLVDPGMGWRRMVNCLASTEAEAFVGISKAHLFRRMFPAAFRGVRVTAQVGGGWPGAVRIDRDADAPLPAETDLPEPGPTDVAAVLFTSGSTGPPKGAVYRHENFIAQVDLLEREFGIRPGEVDLATFPLFALFDAALGVTAVIPDMDPTRPGGCDPERIVAALTRHHCTTMFGSPALLDRVGRYGRRLGLQLTMLRRVISAGAPVAAEIISRLAGLLPEEARILTPYGATEALPVACIAHAEILEETADLTARGEGVCVGRPVAGIEACVIEIVDGAIGEWSAARVLPSGRIGEIVAAGPVVTDSYLNHPAGTARAKIRDGSRVRHRMGDVGWMDESGRIWFCGRAAHRVVTVNGVLYTEPCEAIFNQHPRVRRTALVGVGAAPNQRPVLCVEPEPDVSRGERPGLLRELAELARGHRLTRSIRTMLIHRRFPVDVRHNAKIFREQLAAWAARRVPAELEGEAEA